MPRNYVFSLNLDDSDPQIDAMISYHEAVNTFHRHNELVLKYWLKKEKNTIIRMNVYPLMILNMSPSFRI